MQPNGNDVVIPADHPRFCIFNPTFRFPSITSTMPRDVDWLVVIRARPNLSRIRHQKRVTCVQRKGRRRSHPQAPDSQGTLALSRMGNDTALGSDFRRARVQPRRVLH